MANDNVQCPKCGFSFAIESALAEGIEAKVRQEFEHQLHAKDAEWNKRLGTAQAEFETKLDGERKKIQQQAKNRAETEARIQLEALQNEIGEKTRKLDEAKGRELALLKKETQLQERADDLKLEVARTLAAERKKIQEQAEAKALEEHKLKDQEKNKLIDGMKDQIAELQRKAEQGSQKIQGQVLEEDIDKQLSEAFRTDQIKRVASGVRGADIVQTIHLQNGHAAGTMLWEMKNTKDWSVSWLEKARQNQRDINAEVVIIVSEALPKGLKHFGQMDGVWVCEKTHAVGLATVLRTGIIQINAARAVGQDRATKMEQLYGYLSGIEFRQRVEAIVDCFSTMQKDLASEKSAMERVWAKRRKQLDRVIQSTAGMYGDLQGIVGQKALPTVKHLELPSGSK